MVAAEREKRFLVSSQSPRKRAREHLIPLQLYVTATSPTPILDRVYFPRPCLFLTLVRQALLERPPWKWTLSTSLAVPTPIHGWSDQLSTKAPRAPQRTQRCRRGLGILRDGSSPQHLLGAVQSPNVRTLCSCKDGVFAKPGF